MTFWIHWIAVLCMAALFLTDPQVCPPIILDAAFSETEIDSEALLEYVDISLDQPSTELPATPEEELSTASLASTDQSSTLDEVSLDKLPDALLAMAIDSQVRPPTVKPEKEKEVPPEPMVVPKHAVAAGSFAVWTEPANPDPGEPYRIVIQIRLPEGTRRYSVTDLDGVVVGSDGYQKLIPGSLRGFLPIRDGIVKLEVPIVSADKNVQDTVLIRSKLLREAQRLRIQF